MFGTNSFFANSPKSDASFSSIRRSTVDKYQFTIVAALAAS